MYCLQGELLLKLLTFYRIDRVDFEEILERPYVSVNLDSLVKLCIYCSNSFRSMGSTCVGVKIWSEYLYV